MKRSNFVHLHTHSHYSLLDGASTVEALVDEAVKSGAPALALTDHGNLFGAIEFYQTAQSRGIKPIIGFETYIAPEKRTDRLSNGPFKEHAYHLTLLAKNEQGYHNLLKLATSAQLEGFYYKPRIDKELLALHKDGLICLSGCLHSELAMFLAAGKMADALRVAEFYKELFKDDYFLELHQHNIPEQARVTKGQIEIHKKTGIPMVATNDVHYLRKEDARSHDILLCISTNKTFDDPSRMRLKSDEFYFKSDTEMQQLFPGIAEASSNTLAIAERCRLTLDFKTRHLPRFTPPDELPAGGGSASGGKSLDSAPPEPVRATASYLRSLAEKGLTKRYPEMTDAIKNRLNYELGIIEKMGFVDYFLVVWDFVRFARQQNIPIGPGRGSAAGSILSYALEITDIEPLKYGLLFERFLNPGRNELPDIDIDFSQAGRESVINYVHQRYGKENVAQIITFGAMKARLVIRDVGRVMGIPLKEVDLIAKKIQTETLYEAINYDPELKQIYNAPENPRIKDLFNISSRIEGLYRHASTHAAGVVIADKPLTTYVPLYVASGSVVTQYSMEWLQKIGLLKVDLLGIVTLDVIEKCVASILKIHKQSIDIREIPLDDKAAYELLSRGETRGVFQLESAGMRDLAQKMKPDCFEDIIALVALYRPGPLQSGMVDQYIKCKHKTEEISYTHPSLEPILKETNGVILYQEQVMMIANQLGGFSLIDADDLRKAMGKKLPEIMDNYEKQFIDGARKNKISEETAQRIFELIRFFGGYGFNKSHSTAYAFTAYRTAYLKANYPAEFLAALMSCHRDNTDKIVEYIDEAKRMKIKVLPPDINESQLDFIVRLLERSELQPTIPGSPSAVSDKGALQPRIPSSNSLTFKLLEYNSLRSNCQSTVTENKIRFGLGAVKNVGDKAVRAIIETRAEKPFVSFYDFCERVDLRTVDKSVIDSLVKCGAMDNLGAKRASLLAGLDQILMISNQRQHDRRTGQMNLMGEPQDKASAPKAEANMYPPLPEASETTEEEMLKYEDEVLGFYISGHPLAKYQKALQELSSYTIEKLLKLPDNVEVKVGGIIKGVRYGGGRGKSDKSKLDQPGYFKLRDMSGSIEAVIYPNELKTYRPMVQDNLIVFIKGRLDRKKGEPRITVKEIAGVEEASEKMCNCIYINLNETGLDKEIIFPALKDVFLAHPGTCPVFIRLITRENKQAVLKPSSDYSVSPSKKFMTDMEDLLGAGHITFK